MKFSNDEVVFIYNILKSYISAVYGEKIEELTESEYQSLILSLRFSELLCAEIEEEISASVLNGGF